MQNFEATTIDEYIGNFPPDVQRLLQHVRKIVQDTAPQAEEDIRYAIPTFRLHGKNLVHFAAFQSHIGFYPAPTGMASFKKELSSYKTGKGSVQFPFTEPMPDALIVKMVKFRVEEVTSQTQKKKTAKR